MSWLAANATSIIAIVAALGGYIWKQLHVTNAAQGNAVVQQALAAIGSMFDAYVASASTQRTLADVGIELRGLAAVELGKLGIYEGTALRAFADLGVNALIAQAIATLVGKHPNPAELHAQVRAVPSPVPAVSPIPAARTV